MRDHKTNIKLQESACKALARLSTKDDATLRYFEVQQHRVLAFASGMHRRLGAASCVSSLNELALGMIGDEVLGGQIVRKIAAAGGIQCIVAVMHQHSTHLELQRLACSTLYNLAESADNQIKIQAAGGIEAIVAARNMDDGWVYYFLLPIPNLSVLLVAMMYVCIHACAALCA